MARRFCACTIGCLLTSAELHRNGIVCRYRDGQVKPVSHFVPSAGQRMQDAEADMQAARDGYNPNQ